MMQTKSLEFRIDQMRKDKMIMILETISIAIIALMVTIFLPQLLFQFVFAGQDLTAEPPMLKFIPVISFVVAVGYFLYATVMLVMKKMKINQLEKELAMMMTDDDCCGGGCGCGHDESGHGHDHSWMENDAMDMDDEMTESKPKKKVVAKKKTAKK